MPAISTTTAKSSWPGDMPSSMAMPVNHGPSCVATASLASVPNGPSVDEPAAGRITVKEDQAQSVLVSTYDAAGNPAEEPFNLILAC